jgi:hypothetical protein
MKPVGYHGIRTLEAQVRCSRFSYFFNSRKLQIGRNGGREQIKRELGTSRRLFYITLLEEGSSLVLNIGHDEETQNQAGW